ncbi:hypothetical protein [Pseudogemmobacter bohemicus]|uniref:hypothetical protein n=1 Tax=Pseudogemmobacter bohemicus TaxID=2250708 RepID=UPI000DD2E189|nr:hypothetical protein [Pseudogemmobacter bohemicus]
MASKFTSQKAESPEARIERRWLRSVLATSGEPLPAFPWMRAGKAAKEKKAIEVISGGSHRPTTPLFRRSGTPGGLAAR